MSEPPVRGAKPEAMVLTLNSGSSSLKFGSFRVGASGAETLFAGEIDSAGDATSQREAIVRITQRFADSKTPPPDAVGHRIVHGGPELTSHCLIDDAVLQQLEAAVPFAPLHLPPALAVIRFARERFPDIPQVACFDTTFHARLPEVARTLPIPVKYRSEGIRRYGFHGLSCESILHQLGQDVPDRIVIAHLGNGASVTAVKAGHSIDTSMGLTPTGGVIMGTRSGDLDPGVLIYLMRERKVDADALEELVDRHSGLSGISGVGGDMRRLHEAAETSPDARLAIEMFCYSARKQIAAMIAVLEGIDLLVFTGGIGENDVKVRANICAGLEWAGIGLDAAGDRVAGSPLSPSRSHVRVLVLASEEDDQIARRSWALLSPDRSA
jgi:acetate kinase